ncbi:MAG: hypothetical protein ACKOZT_03275 [Cyanobium sp.]
MARLFLEPTELLLMIGLVLLGLQTRRASTGDGGDSLPHRAVSDRLPLLLPLLWLLGGLIGLLLPSPLPLAPLSAALSAGVGMLVALGLRLRPAQLLPLAGWLAAGVAMVAGSTLAGHAGALEALLGESVAIAVLTVLLAQVLAPPHPRWLAIGLRVCGSWISAASLLMLGWLLRQTP